MGIVQFIGVLARGVKKENGLVQIANAANKIMKGVGKERVTLSGASLSDLPSVFKDAIKGLKNPKVVLGCNAREGQLVAGAVVKDGKNTVGKAVLGLDKTRGDAPILQFRGVDGDNVFSLNASLNPNAGFNKAENCVKNLSSKRGVVNIHDEIGNGCKIDIAHNTNVSSTFVNTDKAAIDSVQKGLKMMHSELEKRDFLTELTYTSNIIKRAFNPGHYSDEIIQIMKYEGKPNIKKANKAKNMLLQSMGYNPKTVKIKPLKDSSTLGGAFNPATGEIQFNSKLDMTNFDMGVIVAHELDHMDMCVKAAKKLGLEEFEKLVTARCPGEKFNKSFYERAMIYCDGSDFNVKPFVETLKRETEFAKLNLTGDYAHYKDMYLYNISALEKRATNLELNILKDIKTKGIKYESKSPIGTGRMPGDDFVTDLMPRIDIKLAKYTDAPDKVFNKKYKEAIEHVYPDMAKMMEEEEKLSEILCKGLPTVEYRKINKKAEALREAIDKTFNEETCCGLLKEVYKML